MNLKSKLYAASAALLASPVMLLAEGEPASGPVSASGSGWGTTFTVASEITPVKAAADGMETMFSNILSMLIKPIGLVLLAGIAIWAMPHIVGIIKSAFNRGKGR